MDILEQISRGPEAILSPEELARKLGKNRPLRVKLGADPTKPDLTLGHAVVLQKLRQFQDLGHTAVLIVGDFTALIGDPSGKSSMRPELKKGEVEENAKTYMEQVYRILDPEKTEIRYNSEWLGKLNFEAILKLLRKLTVARMLERDDFSQRFKSNSPISLVEFVYPLAQAYDSVVVKADIELGGRDQLFNLLVGRQLQKDAGQEQQVVITVPLLIGLDGQQKMSKSLGNYIAFNDSARDVFGKVMSISDDLMWNYWTVLFHKSASELKALKNEHPMAVKKALARAVTAKLHHEEAAAYELRQFEKVFSKGQQPDEMTTLSWMTIADGRDAIPIVTILGKSGLFQSKKEARRMLRQGAVKVDGKKVTDDLVLERPGRSQVVRAGKRIFFKIVP